jgi:glycosyltransferase involved in cell wall biosynthesis
MRIGVVTAVRDGAADLPDTMRSVFSQHARDQIGINYVVQVAPSTDDTEAVVHSLANEAPDGVRIWVQSAPDDGLYDGLANGFTFLAEHGDCDWYAYLNAGDIWDPFTIGTLGDIAGQTDASWVCGLHAYYAADGRLVHTRLPFRFSRSLLRAGAYGRGLPTVQQESTFWRNDLHHHIDVEALRTYRIAGDAFLWWTFAAFTEPVIVQALMGGFRYHGDHLGVSKADYGTEMARFAGPLSLAARARIPLQLVLWEQPARIKARLNPNLYLHSTTTGGWISQRGRIESGRPLR